MRSATAPASTLPEPTATMVASWPPEYITWRKSFSGVIPALMNAAEGTMKPEVEPGSTKAKVLPLRSESELIGPSLGAMMIDW